MVVHYHKEKERPPVALHLDQQLNTWVQYGPFFYFPYKFHSAVKIVGVSNQDGEFLFRSATIGQFGIIIGIKRKEFAQFYS